MRTRSSSNLPGESSPNPTSSNPKCCNRRRSKQPFILKESPEDTMADQRTMVELLHLLRACPHHGLTELHQLDTFYNALNLADQDSLNSATGGNLLERRTQDVLTIIENKSKVRNSQNKLIVSQVKSSDANSSSSSEIAKLTHAVNLQTSVVTTAMTTILKQFQATPPTAFVKAIEEICVTCGAAVNYNQGNFGYRPPSVANQSRPSGFAQPNVQNNQNRFSQPQGYNRGTNFNQDSSYQAPIHQNQVVPLSELEKIKKMNEINMKAMQTQINNVKNELRNEMKTLIQASIPLPSNTIANPNGELKAITTRSGLVLDGPSIPMPSPFINPKEDGHVEETLTDPKLGEFTINAPPPLVRKPKPHSQRNYVVDIFQYPDDLNMPELEDNTYSDDEEDVGAETDFTNLEINITISLTRVHKDHLVTQIIGYLSLATQKI
nr:hypothetical protein [Tanacetum cinerariifolium]